MKSKYFLVAVTVLGLSVTGYASANSIKTFEAPGSSKVDACTLAKRQAEALAGGSQIIGFSECVCSVVTKLADGTPLSFECAVDVTYDR